MIEQVGKPLGEMEGVVKWFKDEKGFGFIQVDGNDFFVHYSGIIRAPGQFGTLYPDQRVTFQAWHGPRGYYATDVRPAA